jgi:hypothetical protein
MTEEKKDSCCTPSGNSCCKGGKKFLMGILIGVLIFAGGFIFAKSNCPMNGKMCHMNGMEDQKMCPIMHKSMEATSAPAAK